MRLFFTRRVIHLKILKKRITLCKFHVLLSNNELLTFDSISSLPKAEITPRGNLVDFIVNDGAFYFIDEDGNLFENDELVTNCDLTGDDLVLG